MSIATRSTVRPEYDDVIQILVDYVLQENVSYSAKTMETARCALMDAMGCALLALRYPACTSLLGPIVPGAVMLDGVHVPGTDDVLDPVRAAFNFGVMIRWLDFNDTWLAAEWGHPSDNLGAILPCAEYVSRVQKKPMLMKTVLVAMIKAYEIQGILALTNSFNDVGLDHVMLVRIASSAVCTQLLGGNRKQLLSAVSNAWLDGSALRTYRHAPNTGSRKSWAAGDAAARGLTLALLAMRGEMGYPSAITAPVWGFQEAVFRGKTITLSQPLATYVMDNVLFKISYPAEFHAQTAVEAAIRLHPLIKNKLHHIQKIVIETQQAAMRIIDKEGPLAGPADRDHCLQYMTAVALLTGKLVAEDYEDAVASDPRIDFFRSITVVSENKQFSHDYLNPEKRSIANSIQVFFEDGSASEKMVVEYPLGHKRRRKEGMPFLFEKFYKHYLTRFDNASSIRAVFENQQALEMMSVTDFMRLF